ncbi:hypothetical protein I6N95_15045 [Vagococcus sp. BWB3-3]|uniref:Resolvase/invertase-type recombinase catalytic domain-containing protein n=1 Tax=Vagococcus allomyrinae TaxID=2794353 RepID=A0A940P770_9ENTE|nr:hypothetical protein [Vagococcus allomyrinae]MBP1042335.1 hypothetical protein [Vagococcus allomyrinae]
MRVGYGQITQRNDSGRHEQGVLKEASCDKVFLERYQNRKKDWQSKTDLLKALDHTVPGDTLVIMNLDQVSQRYQVWLELIAELKRLRIELEIVDYPQLHLSDWAQLFQWVHQQELQSQSSIRVTKFSKERSHEKAQYSALSRDPYFRRAYWDIFRQVMAKRSLRQITKESTAPLSTVVRIRKEYVKLKQTLLLVGTFLLTVISLKLVQTYSSNLFLQILICGVMTLLIVYFTYSDTLADK